MLAGAALTVVLTFAGLAAIDLRLTLAGLLCVPVQVWARALVPAARAARVRGRARGSGERAQALLDAVGGARTIRALGLAAAELPRVEAASQRASTPRSARSASRPASPRGSTPPS